MKQYTYWAGIRFYIESRNYEIYFPEFDITTIEPFFVEDEKDIRPKAEEALRKGIQKIIESDDLDFPVHQTSFPVDINFTYNEKAINITVTV